MAYKPTGNPVGRPPKEDKLEVTFSFKADKAFMDRVKDYAWQRRLSVAELIREGLEWRLEEGDPLAHRYGLHTANNGNEYSGNTESGIKDNKKYSGNTETPISEAPAATHAPPEQISQSPGAAPASPFDPTKYVLGDLCIHGHDYHGSGQSLRRKSDKECLECHRDRTRAYRQRKQQGQPV